MLNVLKKAERPHVVGKAKGLVPPKNLPDLAKDIYDKDDTLNSGKNEGSYGNPVAAAGAAEKDLSSEAKHITEPDKESVPRLDLNLVRQHLASSASAIQSIPENHPTKNIEHEVRMERPTYYGTGADVHAPSYTASRPLSDSEPRPLYPSADQGINIPGISNQGNIAQGSRSDSLIPNNIDDSTGFFKEFEEYVRNNGLDNDIIDDLLGKNWLDHMYFYHTTKGEDMPFYASSAELSHAIRLKLEDLSSLERNWIANKQKVDLLRKLSSTLESEVHLKSEELKRLIVEQRKRGNILRKSDFFHIVKPKDTNVKEADIQESQAAVSHAYTAEEKKIRNENIDGHIAVSKANQIDNASPPIEQRFNLRRYVTKDPSKYFYACNGQVFKSLKDLMEGLETMDQGTFGHHVSSEKNDFSNWIKGVFEDFRLSDSMRSIDEKDSLWYFLKNNTI